MSHLPTQDKILAKKIEARKAAEQERLIDEEFRVRDTCTIFYLNEGPYFILQHHIPVQLVLEKLTVASQPAN